MRKRLTWWIWGLALAAPVSAQGVLQTPEQRYLNTNPALQVEYSDTQRAAPGTSATYTISQIRNSSGCSSIIRDRATKADYIKMPIDFTASPYSPIVYWKGQPVGRAFRKDVTGTYPFLLCESYGSTSVMMRRDLWSHYFSEMFEIKDERVSGTYMYVIIREQGIELESQIGFHEVDSIEANREKWISIFVESVGSLKKSNAARASEMLSEKLYALPFATDNTLNRFFSSSIVVDGVHYAPFGKFIDGEIIVNPRTDKKLGRPFLKETINGQTLSKFVVIGQQPYLALPWWNAEVLQSESDLNLDNWNLYTDNTLKYAGSDYQAFGYAITPPVPVSSQKLSTLQEAWNDTRSAPTRQLWTGYLGSAIKVDGVPAINVVAMSGEYDFEISNTRISQGGDTIALLFDPSSSTPAVRLNGEVFLPVTFLDGVTYDKVQDRLTLRHSETITTTLEVAPFKLKTYTLAQLKQLDQQKSAQQAQVVAQQAAADRQQRAAQQQADQRARAAQAQATLAQQQAQAAFQKNFTAARKAAPDMIMRGLGGDLFGAAKLNNNKLYIRILQVKNGKVIGSCYQQTLNGLHVTSLTSLLGDRGALYVTFTSPGFLKRVAYTYQANNKYCGFTTLP